MHYVSLIIECLRGRPNLVFWTVALTQAALWTLVPALLYGAPPGDVPLVLAVGHEFVLGSYLGPPLAFWLGEMAFKLAGSPGVYLLAQFCIVIAYWAVFTLGRRIVGTRHAVLGVLLMVGIASFAVPSVEFGPAILAAPFWALALLHYWRAVGEGQRGYWFVLALDLGLLLLTSYIGLLLLALLILFTLATAQGRRAMTAGEPWIALILLVIVVLPHALWLYEGRAQVIDGFNDSVPGGRLSAGVWLCLALLAAHAGLALLVALAGGWPRRRGDRAPEIVRSPVGRFARQYVLTFALMPGLAAVAFAFATGKLGPFDALAPLVLMSGLAVMVAAGDTVMLYRERLASSAWLGLLFGPPALVAAGILVLPWIAPVDLKVAQPAAAMGAFFAESFQRRTGQPLAFVSGDERLAPLIALTAPDRPRLYFAWAPDRSPWIGPGELIAHGGVLVWPAIDNIGAPPPTLKDQFPAMLPEAPRAFSRMVQGRLPQIRLGWSVLRPQQAP